jgi:hypothetical protein
MTTIRAYWLLILLIGFSFTARSQDTANHHDPWTYDLEINADFRYYLEEGLYTGQEQEYPAAALTPQLHKEWNKNQDILQFKGFFRYDYQDEKRTHFDVRELYYQHVFKNWELLVGANKIYWGVIESNHVVDFLNQSDILEGVDEKLGQPMVQLSFPMNWGTVDLFVLPYFRTLEFPGEKGRNRPDFNLFDPDIPHVVEKDNPDYNPDFAIRYSHYWKIFDFAVSHFYGTSRTPIFQVDPQFDPATMTLDLNASLLYETIHRTGLELQASTGNFLWKGEGIYRQADRKNIFAYAAGVEYTFGDMFHKGYDLGILAEYSHDDRGRQESFNAMTRDYFLGARLALNDRQSTDFLGGVITDLDNNTQMLFAEASRRIGSSWKLSAEYRGFNKVSPDESFVYLLRQDSYGQVRLTKFFNSEK